MPQAERGEEMILRASRRKVALLTPWVQCSTADLGLLTFISEREYISVVFSRQFVVICYSSHTKLIHSDSSFSASPFLISLFL